MSVGSAIHQNDTGTALNVTVTDDNVPAAPIDLSTATLLEYCFQRPDGTILTRTPTTVSGGADGALTYTTTLSDLTQPGAWKLQVHYTLPGGIDRRADVLSFNVKENVCA